MSDVTTGPMWAARNWSIDAGEGSIHDDATASKLGFRGGTVAGDVHMNQFPPVLIQLFGNEWFERGQLSLDFKNATVDLRRFRCLLSRPKQASIKSTYGWNVKMACSSVAVRRV